jgi:hypothetical protein
MADMHFNIYQVEDDYAIQDFVIEQGLTFKKGQGYYELTKPEIIKGKKSFLLIDKLDGEIWENDEARAQIGVPSNESVKINDNHLNNYKIFVQSSSSNRNLVAGTRFLYAMEESAAKVLRKVRTDFIDYINNVIFDKFDPRREQFRSEMLELHYRSALELEEWRLQMLAGAEILPNCLAVFPEKLCGSPINWDIEDDCWEEVRLDGLLTDVFISGYFLNFSTTLYYRDGEFQCNIEVC